MTYRRCRARRWDRQCVLTAGHYGQRHAAQWFGILRRWWSDSRDIGQE